MFLPTPRPYYSKAFLPLLVQVSPSAARKRPEPPRLQPPRQPQQRIEIPWTLSRLRRQGKDDDEVAHPLPL